MSRIKMKMFHTSQEVPNGPKQLAKHAKRQEGFSPKPEQRFKNLHLLFFCLACHSRHRYKMTAGWAQNALLVTRCC